ncbi:GNAT family N-acetyltransferase [Paenibacillus mendelii]|nr:GNAT family N-acetyltransferase [Paenibacillus mendelii]
MKSTVDLIQIELDIINSDKYFNRISKDKDEWTSIDLTAEINESLNMGAERFLIKDDDTYVGIIEFLMMNPNDGFTWLGLLTIKKEYQHKGYGKQALHAFYKIMSDREVNVFRIGVLSMNEPAHKFWRKQGFKEVRKTTMKDNKEIMIYEKCLEP